MRRRYRDHGNQQLEHDLEDSAPSALQLRLFAEQHILPTPAPADPAGRRHLCFTVTADLGGAQFGIPYG